MDIAEGGVHGPPPRFRARCPIPPLARGEIYSAIIPPLYRHLWHTRGMDLIADLLTRPEGKTLDFKRDLSGKKGVVRDLISFANTSGGVLVVGIDDDRSIRGLANPLAEEEKLASLVADMIRPALLPDIELVTHEGKHLLLVRVARTRGPFYLASEGPENGVYIRLGSTNRTADEAARAELQRALLNVSFDQEPSDIGRDGLDEARIGSVFERLDAPPTDAKLSTLGVLTEHQGRVLASTGGVLLFGTDDVRGRLFPDAHVRCACFTGETKGTQMLDQEDLRTATILEAIDRVDAFIRKNTRTAGVVEGMKRRNIPEYSTTMIRELVVNALAHADYSLSGMQIKVAVFSNRVEITNPGFLPFGMSIDQLKAGESRVRNRVIARVFDDLDYLDGWGRAWALISEAVRQDGYPEPTLAEVGTSFKAVLWPHSAFTEAGESGGMSGGISADIPPLIPPVTAADLPPRPTGRLTPAVRQAWILAAIDQLGGISVPEIMKGLGTPQRTIERDITAMSGVIQHVGPRKTGRYERLAQPG